MVDNTNVMRRVSRLVHKQPTMKVIKRNEYI
jgi:hypothetical protein